MKNQKCKFCEESLESCICPIVAKFFSDNGHLMKSSFGLRREQLHKKRFFYINIEKHPIRWVNH